MVRSASRRAPLGARSRSGVPGALVVSLDFELYWGMRDVIELEAYRANLEGVHEVVPRILDLFAEYEVHATWACVGLLFARNQEEARSWAPRLRPSYHQPRLSPFGDLDSGDLDRNARCYFAPQLIAEIRGRPHQELGTHTFSHYYCQEAGQSAEQFEADLEAALAVAQAHGVQTRSLVFPRNQCNERYLPVLRRQGIVAYRGLRRGWAHAASRSRAQATVRRALRLADNYARVCPDGHTAPPRRDGSAAGRPVDVPGSRFLRPYAPSLRHLEPLRLRRMQQEMTRAAELGRIHHLWWHPHNFGRDPRPNLELLERLLRHARTLRARFDFRSLTMAEATGIHADTHDP